MNHTRKIFFTTIILLLFILGIVTSVYLYTTGFDLEKFLTSLNVGIYGKIGIVLFLYTFRNYLFIPSTVIIIVSGIVFKDFTLTAVIAMTGVIIGLIQTYAIGYLFWEDLKRKKSFDIITKHHKEITKNGAKAIFFGAMFPSLPTDLVCYAAGFIKYNFPKFLLAATAGEFPIVMLYAFLGVQAEKYMSYFVYFIGVFALGSIGWWLWKRKK